MFCFVFWLTTIWLNFDYFVRFMLSVFSNFLDLLLHMHIPPPSLRSQLFFSLWFTVIFFSVRSVKQWLCISFLTTTTAIFNGLYFQKIPTYVSLSEICCVTWTRNTILNYMHFIPRFYLIWMKKQYVTNIIL